MNLISNSIKFTTQGTIEFIIKPSKNGNGENHNLNFIVKDTGIGIEEKNRQKIFETTFKEGSLSNEYGSGIGLLVVKDIYELMNMTVSYNNNSEQGNGSIFTVTMKEGMRNNNLAYHEESINSSNILVSEVLKT